uniref:Uncharacterized protein n=1 Tax=Knipowitschia caucasica TaxID=637954 RepID=A0AAV2JS58_KNICA
METCPWVPLVPQVSKGPQDLQGTLVLRELRVKLDSQGFMEKLVIQVAKEKKVERERPVIKALKAMDHQDTQEIRAQKVSVDVLVGHSMVSLGSPVREVMWAVRDSGVMLVFVGLRGSASLQAALL